MKNITIAALLLMAAASAKGEGIPYSSTIVNLDGSAAAEMTVDVEFAIRDSKSTTLYSEKHSAVTSDAQGRINLTIGEGAPVTGAFRLIDWSRDGLEMEITMVRPDGFSTISVEDISTTPFAAGAATASTIAGKNSADGSFYRLAVDDNGNLATERVEPQVIEVPNGYSKLIFHDEFDYEGLPDPKYWGYEVGYVRSGELQYYTEARPENAYVKNGVLNLVCRNDNWTAPDGTQAEITSASVTTQDKFKFTYGRVDVRAKLPGFLGTWPAIWLMPNDSRFGTWPLSGEIDIMECVGYAPKIVHFTAHCADINGGNTRYHYSVNVPTTTTEFHTYSLVWTEKKLEWLVDNKRRFSIVNSSSTWRQWPFFHDFYVILNYAFGGWGGQNGVDLTQLPSTFEIDYVRVWQ